MTAPYALEGHYLIAGLFTVSRTGDPEKALTVFFETEGTAIRETDYWLELDPCEGCLRPPIHITGNGMTIPPGEESVTIGVNASFEFNSPPGFVEPLLEDMILRLVPARVPGGTISPYMIGNPSEGTVFVVDREDDQARSLMILDPPDNAVFAEHADIPIKLFGPAENAEVFANGKQIGHALYCPPNANCASPDEGRFVELRFCPGAASGATSGFWPNVSSGTYIITAHDLPSLPRPVLPPPDAVPCR